ncbi:MAG: two component, sigma54 specific, transcriptional regulator, Fis family [Deltaproteobacteria bacterium]|nr:two component, sigma54 specific, transcriptional regulator, Fis family [Deltaproteobacteria bacterium]MBP2684335.1 two component, sigma54 specific, transcriptional regulator, Fis family [Deltaproteobacteria bacterium]
MDDEESVREGVRVALEPRYCVRPFTDAESAVEAVREDPPDLVLMDIGLPGMNGIEGIRAIKALRPEVLLIVITAYEDVQTIVAAMKGGAFDYVVKPLHAETLENAIGIALETVRLQKEVRELQAQFLRENVPLFIGESHAIRDVMEFVESAAKSPDTPVLILGPTGTGKELIASAIHFRSPNFRGRMVNVNCAAIPKELLESELFGYEKGAFTGASHAGKKGLVDEAAGGTLFLDEVSDLSADAQAKLLRFLEDGEFYRVGGTRGLRATARVVSATNRDLEALVTKGTFRGDLYYRLAVVRVAVPALRERRDDILPIARYFLVEFSNKFGRAVTSFSPEAEETLLAHTWDGNVRELRNVVERAVLTGRGPQIEVTDLRLGPGVASVRPAVKGSGDMLPPLTAGGVDLASVQESVVRHYIEEALRLADGSETRAAQLLNINYHTFRYRRKKSGL